MTQPMDILFDKTQLEAAFVDRYPAGVNIWWLPGSPTADVPFDNIKRQHWLNGIFISFLTTPLGMNCAG